MIAQTCAGISTIVVTRDEKEVLFGARKQAIQDVVDRCPGLAPDHVAWRWGWKAVLAVHKRDRDGSLLASVTVTAPILTKPYTRRMRLISTQPRSSDERLLLRQR
jgi:CMP-N-acetylneuraminic acid synthetase